MPVTHNKTILCNTNADMSLTRKVRASRSILHYLLSEKYFASVFHTDEASTITFTGIPLYFDNTQYLVNFETVVLARRKFLEAPSSLIIKQIKIDRGCEPGIIRRLMAPIWTRSKKLLVYGLYLRVCGPQLSRGLCGQIGCSRLFVEICQPNFPVLLPG